MLKLEGSRHEKVIIVLAAYVIGLNTAYIAFGVETPPASDPGEKSSYIQTFDQAPAQFDVTTPQTNITESDIQVRHTDDGLILTYEGQTQMLSVNRASVIDSMKLPEAQNGFHYEIIDASLSPNQQFAYFCEQVTKAATACEPFIYDLTTGKLHRVQLPNDAQTVAIATHNATWVGESILRLGTFISSSPEIPWR